MSSDLLVATRTFITVIDGKRVKVTKGKTRVRADHELVKGRESCFKPADSMFDDIETTTAAPSPSRRSRGTAKKTAAKKTAATKTTGKRTDASSTKTDGKTEAKTDGKADATTEAKTEGTAGDGAAKSGE